jgi:hypothetical protein
VVSCVPVPKAGPGSITSTRSLGPAAASQAGTTLKPPTSKAVKLSRKRATQSTLATAVRCVRAPGTARSASETTEARSGTSGK